MFNNFLRGFEEDPFFSGAFSCHRENMDLLMNGFSQSFGSPRQPCTPERTNRRREEFLPACQPPRNERRELCPPIRSPCDNSNNRVRSPSMVPCVDSNFIVPVVQICPPKRSSCDDSNNKARSPSMVPCVGPSIIRVQVCPPKQCPCDDSNNKVVCPPIRSSCDNSNNKDNSQSFSSSSVMQFCQVGNETPKIYEASSSTLCAPGGIKETRDCMKDSESGLHKMVIGHHIKDRGHIFEKTFNNKTGANECVECFRNLDECEAPCFDLEWQRLVSQFMPPDLACQPFGLPSGSFTDQGDRNCEQRKN